MAQIFAAMPGMQGLLAYWYHFAIMFEALFILTTIDLAPASAASCCRSSSARPSAVPEQGKGAWFFATALIVGGWAYFIYTGNINTIWPMFGVANSCWGWWHWRWRRPSSSTPGS